MGIFMFDDSKKMNALSARAAYQLADITKSTPQYEAITPKWFIKLLEWKGLETGVFRLNKVVEDGKPLELLYSRTGEDDIPEGFVEYEMNPREYILNSISAIIKINTRVSDIFNQPHDQIKEQLRLSVESIKERQEFQLINNEEYGLLNNVVETQKIKALSGYPTPDDLDELISKVWKEPSFFLAHPKAIAAFGRECTKRGVPPVTKTIFDSPFITWRGIPIVPTDKLTVDAGSNKSNILLVRVGEGKQGVIGLYQAGLPSEQAKGLSVRFMGIDNNGIGIYLISLYCSAAILSNDAVAVLEDVDVGNYHGTK